MVSNLPVIDMSALLPGGGEVGRCAAVTALREVSATLGFFYVVGHGIEPARLDAVLDHARALFALPEEDKALIAMTRHHGGRGYARMGGRTTAGDLQGPLKEEFYLGLGEGEEPNRWPAHLPGFAPFMLDYLSELHATAAALMSGFALSLDLPDDYFAPFCTDPISALRLVRYSAASQGAGPHADFGSLTILLQDTVGGLQVQNRNSGVWIDAPPLPGSFVVNVGDLFERWTNGRYRSSVHRVVAAGVERFSAPFFLTGAASQVIACLPSCLEPGEVPLYPPVTVAEHLRAGFAAQGF
jgi:isopenicillin N synthase-like dioxygenase